MNKVFRSDIAAQVASEASFPPTFGPFDDFSNWRALNAKIWGKKEEDVVRLAPCMHIKKFKLHSEENASVCTGGGVTTARRLSIQKYKFPKKGCKKGVKLEIGSLFFRIRIWMCMYIYTYRYVVLPYCQVVFGSGNLCMQSVAYKQ